MKFFSRLWKKLKIYIFIDDFDQKYKNTATKLIFILHCCCGGFCFHENVREGFKKFWIIYNVFNFILINTSCLIYLMNAPIINEYYALLLPAPIALAMLYHCGVYTWVYFAKDFFSKLFDYLDDKDFQSTRSVPLLDPRENYAAFRGAGLKEFQIKIVFAWCCIVFMIPIMIDFEKFINCDHYFVILYPMYVPQEKTVTLRFVVRLVQIISIMPEIIVYAAIPSSIFIITADIYNRFELMSLFLREASHSTFQRLEEIYNLEIAMVEERIPSSLTKMDELKIKKTLAHDKFLAKTIHVIKEHRQLYPIAKLYQEKMNLLCVAGNMIVFTLTVLCIFFISLVIETKSFEQSIWSMFTNVCVLLTYWFLFCFSGEMFRTMNDLIATEIHFSPWYHLVPKDRQLILTYLAILQRPISITDGGAYEVNLSSFPSTMNNIYTHVQILRTLQSKSKRL